MSQPAQQYYSPEEYLALEEKSAARSEYFRGRIYQMAGGTARHNLISSNINAALNNALLESDYYTFSSDMRLLVKANGLYTYSGGSVVCGEIEYAGNREDTITNPVLIVEVLSKSTRNYDRGDKFELYRALDALKYYLVVDQSRLYVELHRKQINGAWELETFDRTDQVISLAELGITLELSRFYRKVSFPDQPPRGIREQLLPHPDPTEN